MLSKLFYLDIITRDYYLFVKLLSLFCFNFLFYKINIIVTAIKPIKQTDNMTITAIYPELFDYLLFVYYYSSYLQTNVSFSYLIFNSSDLHYIHYNLSFYYVINLLTN